MLVRMTRIVCTAALIILFAACSRTPSVDLPRVASIGPAASDLDLDRVTVTVTADGARFTPEGELTGGAFLDWLQSIAGRSRDKSLPQHPSKVHLVLRADASTPWELISEVLQAALDPGVRMNRVVFAVRSTDPSDAGEGTFAFFLPLDRGLADAGKDGTDWDRPIISVGPALTLEEILTLVDRLVRSKAMPEVVFFGAPGGEGLKVWKDNQWVDARVPEPAGRAPGRSSGLTGITESSMQWTDPILLDPGLYEDDELPPEKRLGR